MRTLVGALRCRGVAWLGAETGQGVIEYTLLVALIALVAIAALMLMGAKMTTELSTIATTIAGSA